MIVTDVDCAEVPVFVDVKIYAVNGVQDVDDYDGVGDVAVELVLIGGE